MHVCVCVCASRTQCVVQARGNRQRHCRSLTHPSLSLSDMRRRCVCVRLCVRKKLCVCACVSCVWRVCGVCVSCDPFLLCPFLCFLRLLLLLPLLLGFAFLKCSACIRISIASASFFSPLSLSPSLQSLSLSFLLSLSRLLRPVLSLSLSLRLSSPLLQSLSILRGAFTRIIRIHCHSALQQQSKRGNVCACVCVCVSGQRTIQKDVLPLLRSSRTSLVCAFVCGCVWLCVRGCAALCVCVCVEESVCAASAAVSRDRPGATRGDSRPRSALVHCALLPEPQRQCSPSAHSGRARRRSQRCTRSGQPKETVQCG